MLRIYLFGSIKLETDKGPLRLPSLQKAVSLLAYLVLHRGKLHSRSHLVGLFWPQLPESKARRHLSNALWHIRKVLEVAPEAPYIATEGDRIGFIPVAPYWLDVEEFERLLAKAHPEDEREPSTFDLLPAAIASLEKAIALYRGDLLEGLYDDWLLVERERLREKYFRALEHLRDFFKRQGDFARALHYAQLLAQYDPLRESAHCEVMRLYWLTGRPYAALEQYERLRERLLQELNLEPMESTTALYLRIRQEVERKAPTRPSFAEAEIPLVGREKERAQLLERLERMLQGRGGAVLVEGEAGVGKSRLLQEIASLAVIRGVGVAWGQGFQAEQHIPYSLARKTLENPLTPLLAEQLSYILPGIWLQVAGSILLRLKELLSLPSPEPELPPEDARKRLLEALSRYVLALGTVKPYILVMEDVHWADEATLEFLSHLLPHLTGSRILLLLSARRDYLSRREGLLRLVHSAQAADLLTYLHLPPLGQQDAVELMALTLKTSPELLNPSTAQKLYRSTGGNPFFIIELVKKLRDEGAIRTAEGGVWILDDSHSISFPSGIEQAILSRLATLRGQELEALKLATVIGHEVEFPLWLESSSWSAQQALEVISSLVKSGLLVETERGYRFAHELIAQALYQRIPFREKKALHSKVGHILESRRMGEVEELARHFFLGGVWDKATFYYRKAGQKALSRYALREAAKSFTRAIEASQKASLPRSHLFPLYEQRALVYLKLQAFDEALEDYQRLLKLAWETGRDDEAALAFKGMANVASSLNQWDKAVAWARRALLLARRTGDLLTEAMALNIMANFHSMNGQAHRARKLRLYALHLCKQAGDIKQATILLVNLGTDFFLERRYKPALSLLKRSSELAGTLGLFKEQINCLKNMGHVYLNLGQYDEAIKAFQEALNLSEEAGLSLDAPLAFIALGYIHMLRADYEGAESFLHRALTIGKNSANSFITAWAMCHLGTMEARRGKLNRAFALLQGAVSEAERTGLPETQWRVRTGLCRVYTLLQCPHRVLDFYREAQTRGADKPSWQSFILVHLAEALTVAGAPQEALPLLDRALALADRTGESPVFAQALLEKGKALKEMGHAEEARECAEASLGISEPQGDRWLIAEGHLLRGLALQTLGMYPEAQRALYRAVAECRESNLALLKWKALLKLGRFLQGQGRRDEARTLLVEAAKTVEALQNLLEDPDLKEGFLGSKTLRELYRTLGCAPAPWNARRLWVKLARPNAPTGRPLRADEKTEVLWTVDAGPQDEDLKKQYGKVTLRRHRILRLLQEAHAQGGLPTEEDLARALGVTSRTIRNDIAWLRAQGYTVLTRGTRKG